MGLLGPPGQYRQGATDFSPARPPPKWGGGHVAQSKNLWLETADKGLSVAVGGPGRSHQVVPASRARGGIGGERLENPETFQTFLGESLQ